METLTEKDLKLAAELLRPAQTVNPNKPAYLMTSNLSTDGMDERWVKLWQQIEIWYGDPKKLETCEQLLQRLQKLYSLTERVGGI